MWRGGSRYKLAMDRFVFWNEMKTENSAQADKTKTDSGPKVSYHFFGTGGAEKV